MSGWGGGFRVLYFRHQPVFVAGMGYVLVWVGGLSVWVGPVCSVGPLKVEQLPSRTCVGKYL